ncbi:glucosamine-6-phosphate deaminase [Kwoniella sp. CBS 9459]
MYLQTFATSEDASQAVAQLIIDRIKSFGPTQHRKFVLGLPTGGTPVRVYAILAERCEAGDISFEHVVSINLDEYVGLPPTHEQSYHYFMEKHFFSKVDIPPSQTHILPGIPIRSDPAPAKTIVGPSSSLDGKSLCHAGADHGPTTDDGGRHQASCAAYEALITSLGGINLLFMGSGANGHVGFNEPGSSFFSRTRVVQLNEGTRVANARFFADLSQVPTHALSMGVGTILEAEEIIVLAIGLAKAHAIQRAVEGGMDHMALVPGLGASSQPTRARKVNRKKRDPAEISPLTRTHCPASALQQHERVTIVADSSASSRLKEETKDYLGSQAYFQACSCSDHDIQPNTIVDADIKETVRQNKQDRHIPPADDIEATSIEHARAQAQAQ